VNFPTTKKELMRCNQVTKRYRFCFLYRFFLYDMNIFIYGIIFRDMGDFECYMGDFECYMGYFECYMGDFEYIITNLVLIIFF